MGAGRTAKRSHALAIGIGLGLLMVPATPAAAQETQAATCPGPRANYVTNGTAEDRFAQIFVPTLSGNLTRAEIDYREPAGKTGDYVIQILAVDGMGNPTETVLAQTTAPDLPDGTVTTLNAVFSNPASVVAGQTYALALSRPGAGAGAFDWGYRFDSATCPGQFFYQNGGTGPWVGSFGSDQLFSVFVTPPVVPDPAPTDTTDTVPPETTLTGQPKAKTNKKAATFTFTSSEANSSFECSLNATPFVSCTSPHGVKGRKGKNSFAVRAKDAAGNVDPTPASFDWKVKKKKRRRAA